MWITDNLYEVPCPRCGAPRGQPCNGVKGERLIARAIHSARYCKMDKKYQRAAAKKSPEVARWLKESKIKLQTAKKNRIPRSR